MSAIRTFSLIGISYNNIVECKNTYIIMFYFNRIHVTTFPTRLCTAFLMELKTPASVWVTARNRKIFVSKN